MMAEKLTLVSTPSLNVVDIGSGAPVVFQHGLGGDRNQIADSFPADLPCRRVTVECRGHGLSAFDPKGRYSIARFADDVIATADGLGLERFSIGGISMGAAVALNIACRFPDRIDALALVRPAWLTAAAPTNMQPFVAVAHHLRAHGAEGRDSFAASPIGLYLAEHAPDNLASLLGFFAHPEPGQLATLLLDIALDGPGVTEDDLAAIRVPTLTVGHGVDVVHPLDYARKLASLIPGAVCAEITPKAVDRTAYAAELKGALSAFFRMTSRDSRT
jgi:pimeloyl-ACP methyl ester carboxylesterase